MRSSLFLILGLSIARLAVAIPSTCVSGTYTSYVALGSGGCTSGDILFNNFSTLGFLNSPGVSTLPSDDIEVTPGGTLLNPTLTFTYINGGGTATPVTVNQNGQIFSLGFNYDMTLTGANLNTVQMDSTFSNTSPGSASATKNAQLLAGGTIYTSTVSDGGSSNSTGTYNGAVTPVTGTGVWVINDTTSLQAQTGGSVTENAFENLFALSAVDTSTPEPVTGLLIGSGLVCLGLVSRRRSKS